MHIFRTLKNYFIVKKNTDIGRGRKWLKDGWVVLSNSKRWQDDYINGLTEGHQPSERKVFNFLRLLLGEREGTLQEMFLINETM